MNDLLPLASQLALIALMGMAAGFGLAVGLLTGVAVMNFKPGKKRRAEG